MVHATLSKTEESSHEQIKNQDNDYNLFNSRGVVYTELVPPGIAVNQNNYLEVLDRQRKTVMPVRM
jgi:hypothetical protein